MRKIKLCLCIIRNFGRLLSPAFWMASWRNPAYVTAFLKLIFAGALCDAVRMVFLPGYPEEDKAP